MKRIQSTKITYTEKVENSQHAKKQERAIYKITFLECENHLALDTEIHYNSIIKLYSNGAIECVESERVIFSQDDLIDVQHFSYDNLPNKYKRALKEFFKHGNMIFSVTDSAKNYSNAIIKNVYKSLQSDRLTIDVNLYM